MSHWIVHVLIPYTYTYEVAMCTRLWENKMTPKYIGYATYPIASPGSQIFPQAAKKTPALLHSHSYSCTQPPPILLVGDEVR
jgi:hypothetical protein